MALLAVIGAGHALAEGPANSKGEVPVKAEAALTSGEQVEQAESIARRAAQLAARLTRLLDEARREKDIMRANCVNRKLTEVNANTRNVEQRVVALKSAAESGDDARRGHEYTVLTVLSAKLNSLDQEATQCLGQGMYEPGASQVITTVSESPTFIDPSTTSTIPPAPPSVTVPPPLSAVF